MKQMKKFLLLVIGLSFTVMACNPVGGNQDSASLPTDLSGLNQLLEQKKSESKQLVEEIAQIEAKIAELDPQSQEVVRTLVTTEVVTKTTFEHFVTIQGNVESDDLVNASSETGGRIVKLRVKEGQRVSRGSLIAVVDMETLKKQIQEIETSLDLAKIVYTKQSKLWEQEIGSEIQYLQAKNNKERLEKSLETAKSQLKKANIYAPITGVVDMLFLKEGEMAAPGSPIVQILNTRLVKVVAEVPDRFLGKVKRGDRVKILFPAIDREELARVTLIGRTINPANRTFTVEVEIPNREGILKPNLLAEMQFKDEEIPESIVVPLYLVQQEVGGNKYMFVRDKNDQGDIAKKVLVTTGLSYNDQIIISEGVSEQDELIIEGALGLSDQEPIEIVEPVISKVQ